MCCLFGIMDYEKTIGARKKHRLLNVLAEECEDRGSDATGIAYVCSGALSIYKRPLPAHKLRLAVPADTTLVMGHTRLATKGSRKHNKNNHPFPGRADQTDFALAHNGVLYNDDLLKITLDLPDTDIETDSYVAVQILEKYGKLSFESLKYMAENLKGSFTITIMDVKNNLYIVKGSNPICLYRFPSLGFYVYASTEDILKKAIRRAGIHKEKHSRVFINDGDIFRINADGVCSSSSFDQTDMFYWWNDHHFDKKTVDAQDEYIKMLKEYAWSFGVDPETIDRLAALDYSAEEIEDIISDPYFVDCFPYCSDF